MNYIKVGMDASKEKVVCAWRANGLGDIRVATVANREEALKPWINKLQGLGVVQACYEASSVGYALYRWLAQWGVECEVIAPSLIPKKPGNHVKTDRRDAKELLTLMEAGLLTPIRIPTVQEEALRDLVRSRMDMQKCLTMQKHRLNQLMQRHGRIFPGKAHWTRQHHRWLDSQEFSEMATQRTAGFYRRWVEQGIAELARVDEAIQELGPQYKESYALAEKLMCFQGIDTLSGIGLSCELMDLRRFSKAAELMAYTGLTGREYSSGDVIKRRGITKAGNAHVRHILIQAAWKYIHQPDKVPPRLREHWKTQPAALETLSRKAKYRLHKRYWHLVNAGKARQKAIVAVAREFTGFLWAAAQVETTAA